MPTDQNLNVRELLKKRNGFTVDLLLSLEQNYDLFYLKFPEFKNEVFPRIDISIECIYLSNVDYWEPLQSYFFGYEGCDCKIRFSIRYEFTTRIYNDKK